MITKAKLMQRLERLEQRIQPRHDFFDSPEMKLALAALSDEDLSILTEHAERTERGDPPEYTAELLLAAERLSIAHESAKQKIADQRLLYFTSEGRRTAYR